MEEVRSGDPGRPWCVAPAALPDVLRSHRGLVIVDLDETLYLRNSTEDFLSCASPKALGKLSMAALGRLKPWRLTGGEATRDVWRVLLTVGLFPWTIAVWHLRCRALAARHVNGPLRDLLAEQPDVLVATNGFGVIVRALIGALLPAGRGIVSCRLSFGDRRAGKLALLERCVGREAVSRSLVITDSMDDAPLLAACARGCLVRWPSSAYEEALAGVYVPFQYLAKVKRPNTRYIWNSIVQEDLAFWILACSAASHAALPVVAGASLLCVSFWAAYETGYVDNDRMAQRFERDPKLSAAFAGHRVPTPVWTPWLWAAAFGGAGVAVLDWPGPPSWSALLSWAALLAGTKACFTLFNRVDKRTRVWLFAPLQAARAAGILAVASTSPIGVAGLGAHAVTLWLPYLCYRHRPAGGWPDLPVFTCRLLTFLVFAALLFSAGDATASDGVLAGAFLAWNLFRARKEVAAAVRSAHRIDRERPSISREAAPRDGAQVAR